MKVIKLLLVTLLSFISFDMYVQAHAEIEQGSAKTGMPPRGAVKSAYPSEMNDLLVLNRTQGSAHTQAIKTETPSRGTAKNEDPSAMNDLLGWNRSREELSQNEPAQAGNKGGIALVPEAKETPVAKPEASTQASRGDNFVLSPQEESNQQARLDQAVSNKDLNVKNLKTLNPLKYPNDLIASAKDGSIDVNTKDVRNNTALHYTTYKGTLEDTQNLLNLGANPDVKDGKNGNTPLHLAVENGDSAKVAALIKAGANPNIKNNKGETPLFNAARNGDNKTVTALLQSTRTNVNEPLVYNVDNVDKKDVIDGATALHTASSRGHADVMQTLINYGANVNAKSEKYGTPLDVAKNRDTTQLLLKNRPDKDVLNPTTGKTANLHKNMSDRASDAWNAFTKPMRDAWASFKNLFKSETKEAVEKEVNSYNTLAENMKNELAAKEKAFKAEVAKSGDISATVLARKSSRTDDEQTLVSHVDQTIKDFETLRNLKEAHNQIVQNPQRSGSDADIQRDAQSMDDISKVLQDDLVDIAMRAQLLNDQAILTKVETAMGDKFDEITKLASEKIAENEKAAKNKAYLESIGIYEPSSPAPTKLPVKKATVETTEPDAPKNIIDMVEKQMEADKATQEPVTAQQEQSNEEVATTESKDDESGPKYAPSVPPKTAELGYNAAPPIPGNAPQGDVSSQFVQNEITPNLTTSRVASEDNADAFNDLLNLQRDENGRPLIAPAPPAVRPAAPAIKPAPPAVRPAPPALRLQPNDLLSDIRKGNKNMDEDTPQQKDIANGADPVASLTGSDFTPPPPPAPRSAQQGKQPAQSTTGLIQQDSKGRPLGPDGNLLLPPAPRSALNSDVLKALKKPTDSNQQADASGSVSPKSIADTPGDDENANPVRPKLSFSSADLEGKAVNLKTTQQQAQKTLPKPTPMDQLLKQVKQGANLKKVDTTQPKPQEVIDTKTAAGALRNAVTTRGDTISGKSDDVRNNKKDFIKALHPDWSVDQVEKEVDKQINDKKINDEDDEDDEDDDTGIEGVDSTPVVAPKPVPQMPVSSSRSASPGIQRPASPTAISDGVSSRSTSPVTQRSTSPTKQPQSLLDAIKIQKGNLTKVSDEEVKTSPNIPEATSQPATGGLLDSKNAVVSSMLSAAQAKSVVPTNNDDEWN